MKIETQWTIFWTAFAVTIMALTVLPALAQGQLAIPVHVTMGGNTVDTIKPDGTVESRPCEVGETPHRVWLQQNFQDVCLEIADGDVFEDCNLQAKEPHTPFAPGVKGLVFRRCNLLNRDLPDGAKLEGPNLANVHQRFVVVLTKTAAEVTVQNVAIETAIKTAEAAVASAPVAAKTVSAATAEIEAKKQAAVSAEVAKVADKSVEGLMGRGNPDGSVTFGRLEIVK